MMLIIAKSKTVVRNLYCSVLKTIPVLFKGTTQSIPSNAF